MREKKYRLFNTIDKVMIDKPNSIRIVDGVMTCDDEDILIEYTGLKDKNGVEIYEGDVIKWSSNRHWWTAVIRPLDRDRASNSLYAVELKHNVTTNEDGDCYTYEESNSRAGARKELPFLNKNTVVLGNIHSNPDLLNGNRG